MASEEDQEQWCECVDCGVRRYVALSTFVYTPGTRIPRSLRKYFREGVGFR